MDDYEKNAFDLNNEASEKDYSEIQNESLLFFLFPRQSLASNHPIKYVKILGQVCQDKRPSMSRYLAFYL